MSQALPLGTRLRARRARSQIYRCGMQSWQEMAEGKKKVNVALCGFGRAGRIHFNGVRQNHRIALKYIVDKLDNKAAGADSQLDISVGDFIHSQLAEFNLEGVQVVDCSKYDTVLQDSSIDAVVIATPTYTHEEYVTKALQAKKAVFCEKPIAFSVESTARCYDKAAKEGVPLYCAFQRRFDPGFSRIHRQVKEGTIGKVYQIKTTSRDSPRPSIEYLKISNRMYHDCAVHDIDMVCWIVGEEPEGVFAQGTTRDPEIIAALDDIDTAAIILKFPSGVLAIIDLSRHSKYGYDQRLEVSQVKLVHVALIVHLCSEFP